MYVCTIILLIAISILGRMTTKIRSQLTKTGEKINEKRVIYRERERENLTLFLKKGKNGDIQRNYYAYEMGKDRAYILECACEIER